LINNRQGGRRRGRGGGGGGPPRSNNPGPGNRQDNRQRGNAAQLLEKYKGLARDMQMQGDRVQTEYYLQFADHYFRVLNENRARFEEQRRQRDDYEDDGEEYEVEADAETDVRDEPRRETREPREDRFERPERGNEDRPERSGESRAERNGEYRAQRRPRTRRPEADEDEGQSERISLDVLPPAISAANEDAVDEGMEAKPARVRRPRRPRATDEDIAPAA
jgi:hypothetical protein